MTDGLKPIGGGYGAAAFGTGPYIAMENHDVYWTTPLYIVIFHS